MKHPTKKQWGPGPWQDEPDELFWRDAATGLPCAIVRNTEVSGCLCGYVGVPPGHPLFGLSYGDKLPLQPGDLERLSIEKSGAIPLFLAMLSGEHERGTIEVGMALQVHGGVTWAREHCPMEGVPGGRWWFGFDCGHAGDLAPGIHALLRRIEIDEGRTKSPLSDPGTDDVYRTLAFVRAECIALARQLAAFVPRDAMTPKWHHQDHSC